MKQKWTNVGNCWIVFWKCSDCFLLFLTNRKKWKGWKLFGKWWTLLVFVLNMLDSHHKCGFRSRFMVGLAPNSSDTAVKLQHYKNMRFSIEVYGGSGTKFKRHCSDTAVTYKMRFSIEVYGGSGPKCGFRSRCFLSKMRFSIEVYGGSGPKWIRLTSI